MKNLIALLILVSLVAGSAWAAEGKVKCTVNGVKKKVATVEACTAMGGTVETTPAAK